MNLNIKPNIRAVRVDSVGLFSDNAESDLVLDHNQQVLTVLDDRIQYLRARWSLYRCGHLTSVRRQEDRDASGGLLRLVVLNRQGTSVLGPKDCIGQLLQAQGRIHQVQPGRVCHGTVSKGHQECSRQLVFVMARKIRIGGKEVERLKHAR